MNYDPKRDVFTLTSRELTEACVSAARGAMPGSAARVPSSAEMANDRALRFPDMNRLGRGSERSARAPVVMPHGPSPDYLKRFPNANRLSKGA